MRIQTQLSIITDLNFPAYVWNYQWTNCGLCITQIKSCAFVLREGLVWLFCGLLRLHSSRAFPCVGKIYLLLMLLGLEN